MEESKAKPEEKEVEKENEKKLLATQKKEEKNEHSPSKVTLSKKMRWTVFTVLILCSVIMDFDQGIISSSTTELKIHFDIDDQELGGLGSMIFLGIGIGCLVAFTLINKLNRKYLLIVAFSFKVLSLFFTTLIKNLPLLYIFRVIAGFTMSFLNIYVPVWIDQFGIHKHKSIMIAFIHLSSSLGYLIGYIIGIVMGWINAFYLDCILFIIHIAIIFAILPERYFSMNLIPLKGKLAYLKKEEVPQNQENQESEIILTDETKEKLLNQSKDVDDNIENVDDEEKNITQDKDKEKEENKKTDKEDNDNPEQKENKEENKEINNNKQDDDNISLFEDMIAKNQDIRKESPFKHLKVLLKSPIFILMNILLSSMFIIISTIQFWISDYMENCLYITDEKVRLYAFAIIIMTSPVSGVILGGILSGKIGGYDTEKAIYIPLISSFFVCILANIVPLSDKPWFFAPFFWFYLFLGSLILPVTNGIILVSVEKQYAGSASTVSNLLFNMLGRLPGPNLYAFYKKFFNEKNSRIPFWLVLDTAIIGFLSVLICVKFQKQKYRNLRKNQNEENDKKEEEKDKEKIVKVDNAYDEDVKMGKNYKIEDKNEKDKKDEEFKNNDENNINNKNNEDKNDYKGENIEI